MLVLYVCVAMFSCSYCCNKFDSFCYTYLNTSLVYCHVCPPPPLHPSLSPPPLPPLASWKTNRMGDLSTAGTTASIIIFRQNHIFVANVGDSTTILGEVNPKAGEPGQHAVRPRVLTKDHKPDDPAEIRQVESRGKPSLSVCVCVPESIGQSVCMY